MFSLRLDDTPEAQEDGRKLFAGPCDFLMGVVEMDELPPPNRIEFCFAGRSNVGKSSLINALTGRKTLARTSNTPGRTQEINFFTLGDARYLVDVPGYGFANAPLQVVRKWQDLLKLYLSGRPSLRRVFVLIDARRGIRKVDEEIMKLLSGSAVNFQIIFTKIDKIKPPVLDELVAQTAKILSRYPAAFPELIATSAQSGEGIALLRATIAEIS